MDKTEVFECEFCQKLFTTKRSLVRHVLLHTGNKFFPCFKCDSVFSRSDHLKIHLKSHDPEMPFQCPICNCGFKTQAAFSIHFHKHQKKPSVGRFVDQNYDQQKLLPKKSSVKKQSCDFKLSSNSQGSSSNPESSLHESAGSLSDQASNGVKFNQEELGAALSALAPSQSIYSSFTNPYRLPEFMRTAEEVPNEQAQGQQSFLNSMNFFTFPLFNPYDYLQQWDKNNNNTFDYSQYIQCVKSKFEAAKNQPFGTSSTLPFSSSFSSSLFSSSSFSPSSSSSSPNPIQTKTCSYCSESFEKVDELEEHIFRCHALQKVSVYPCCECPPEAGSVFYSPADMAAHFAEAHTRSYFQCLACKIFLGSKSELDEHIFNSHKEGKLSSVELQITCALCETTWSSDEKLKEHVRAVHTKTSQTAISATSTAPQKFSNFSIDSILNNDNKAAAVADPKKATDECAIM